MSEEILEIKQENEAVEVESSAVNAAEAPAEIATTTETTTENAASAEPVVDTAANSSAEAESTSENPAESSAYNGPKVIVQKERGFAHYVGFALLSVLCIFFFFMPGIALTFAVSLIPGISLGAIAAWTFSAILSVVAWVIFKLKIKGFKKSFYWYIGLCVLVLTLLIAIEIMTESYGVFGNIFALLTGANG